MKLNIYPYIFLVSFLAVLVNYSEIGSIRVIISIALVIFSGYILLCTHFLIKSNTIKVSYISLLFNKEEVKGKNKIIITDVPEGDYFTWKILRKLSLLSDVTESIHDFDGLIRKVHKRDNKIIIGENILRHI